MHDRRVTKVPGFFWQGALIILPVILLAAVGLFSLRQDKALATQEAKERAQFVADELTQRLWTKITGLTPSRLDGLQYAAPTAGDAVCCFRVDQQGNLIFPKPYKTTPLPRPIDLAGLTKEQVQRWQMAREAEYNPHASLSPTIAWRRFLEDGPPPDYQSAAWFALGLASIKENDRQAASNAFTVISRDYPNAIGESGLPLKPLADLQRLALLLRQPDLELLAGPDAAQKTSDRRLELMYEGDSTNQASPSAATSESHRRLAPAAGRPGQLDIDAVCRDSIDHPSILTPLLLAKASQWRTNGAPADREGTIDWPAVWERHELERHLYRAAAQLWPSNAVPSRLYWLNANGPWLVIPVSPASSEATNEVWLACWPEAAVCTLVHQAILNTPTPDYTAITVELAGRRLAPGETTAAQASSSTQPGSASSPKAMVDHRIRPNAASRESPLLATASKMAGDVTEMKVAIHLANASLLYARQRTRTFWFGTLIATAAVAGLVGLLAAWRAFHRQLRLSQMKSDFVSSVSHELRAPIASVRLMAEGLQRGRVQAEEKKTDYFRFIVQECRRLSALIENVLDFARIEQGRKQYEMEPTDVQALVQQTVQLMEPYALERQVKLETVLHNSPLAAPEMPPSLDGRAIQQALVNLISNALKHSPANGTVTVGLEIRGSSQDCREPVAFPSPPSGERVGVRGHKQGALLELWVEDHGDGIPPEEQERIFERFYRRGSELRRETQGVGIGLSIVKHIVEAHGGRVAVRSAVGQGSRFTIEIPIFRRD